MGLTAWAQEQQAKHEAWREIDELKRQNAALVAERDALVAENAIFRGLLKMAQDEFIEAHSDGETDCVTPYDVYHAGPTQCLRKIQSDAGRAGYIQALKDFAPVIEDFSESDFKAADIYAARVRQGGL